MMGRVYFFLLLILVGCSGLEESEKEKIRQMNASGECIYRLHDEVLFSIDPPVAHKREKYPWEDRLIGNQVKLTKEAFRCKGSHDHPPVLRIVEEQTEHLVDCGGTNQHSLPLKEGKEFIYPALLELLNYVQEKLQRKVVITCGHRCPTHNTYADSSAFNRNSKHMMGAEVDFYVQGLELSPEKVLKVLMGYYTEHPRYKKEAKYTQFFRYEKESNVSTLPWFNKEIFIKLFKKDEGRDLDNDHRYPYICIQLKWEREKDEPLLYSWAKAFNGYLRY